MRRTDSYKPDPCASIRLGSRNRCIRTRMTQNQRSAMTHKRCRHPRSALCRAIVVLDRQLERFPVDPPSCVNPRNFTLSRRSDVLARLSLQPLRRHANPDYNLSLGIVCPCKLTEHGTTKSHGSNTRRGPNMRTTLQIQSHCSKPKSSLTARRKISPARRKSYCSTYVILPSLPLTQVYMT